MASKTELLNFLDKHVFHPILNAKEDHYDERHRQILREVKRRTEEEKGRFHGYDSPERIVAMYKDDLTSEVVRPLNANLKDLKLPTLADVRPDFLKLAGESA